MNKFFIINKICIIYNKEFLNTKKETKKLIYNINFLYIINNNQIDLLKIAKNLNFYKKRLYKFKNLNLFNYFNIKKLQKKFNFNEFSNKFYCFWPLFKKKLGFIYHKITLMKNQKKKLISKKTKKNQKKVYYFNFHRKTIKYFWKSQEHFKVNFLKKMKFTVRKFKKKFENWYKKNKKNEFRSKDNVFLDDFLIENLIFLSKNIIKHLLKLGLIKINGKIEKTKQKFIQVNDIICLPENYISFFFAYLKNKFFLNKKIKKIKFIYYKNKRSQWKSLKKKTPNILFFNIFNKNKLFNTNELDFFSSKICFIKKLPIVTNYNFFYNRHNLEKLNTYKLNV